MRDGHLVHVSAGRILKSYPDFRVATFTGPTGVVKTLPYQVGYPAYGQIWRVIEFQNGLAFLQDKMPNADFSDLQDDSDVEAVLGTVTLSVVSQGAGTSVFEGAVFDSHSQIITTVLATLDILVSDGQDDAEPSSVATLTAGASGVIEAGGGTAQIFMRVADNGRFSVNILSPGGNYYVWVRQGQGSPVWIRHLGGPLQVMVM